MIQQEDIPDVSVIVPVYNVETYLRSCLESLAKQTLKSIEIVMVNDGSTDGSSDIAAEFETRDQRFRLFHQKNAGLSAARNTGMNHARGKFIGFVDSDDFVDHSMYERLYNTALNHEADIVKSGVILFDDATGNIQDLRQIIEPAIIHHSPEEALTAFLQKRMNIVVVNGIYSRDIFDDLTFVKGVKYEDHYFTPNALLRCKRLVQIDDIHYFYRKRKGSLTGVRDPKGRADKVQSLNELYKVLRETDSLEAYSTMYSEYFMSLVIDYHNSVVHTAPMRLRKGRFALNALIDPRIIRFVLSTGYLSDESRADLKLMSRSHILFFLRQKLKRLLEIPSGGSNDSNKLKKQKAVSTGEDLKRYQKYIAAYR